MELTKTRPRTHGSASHAEFFLQSQDAWEAAWSFVFPLQCFSSTVTNYASLLVFTLSHSRTGETPCNGLSAIHWSIPTSGEKRARQFIWWIKSSSARWKDMFQRVPQHGVALRRMGWDQRPGFTCQLHLPVNRFSWLFLSLISPHRFKYKKKNATHMELITWPICIRTWHREDSDVVYHFL